MKTKILVPIAAFLALTSCSNMRQNLGLEREAPDEYSVTPSQVPLEMPPDFYKLPPPHPGTPRPQETHLRDQAHEMLTGHSYSHAPHQAPSSGIAAFRQKAGIESGQGRIRPELDRKADVERHSGDKTIAQHLGIKEFKPGGDRLKPVEEQKRLQQAGVATSKYVPEEE